MQPFGNRVNVLFGFQPEGCDRGGLRIYGGGGRWQTGGGGGVSGGHIGHRIHDAGHDRRCQVAGIASLGMRQEAGQSRKQRWGEPGVHG